MKAKLLKSHTHEGKLYNIGDVIDVDKDTYEWLATQKVATYDSVSMEEKVATKVESQPQVVPVRGANRGVSQPQAETPTQNDGLPSNEL